LYWIGLRRTPPGADKFTWVDGTPLGSFQGWSSNEAEPSNDNEEDCVTLGHPCCGEFNVYPWFDVTCSNVHQGSPDPGYICQRLSCNNFLCCFLLEIAVVSWFVKNCTKSFV